MEAAPHHISWKPLNHLLIATHILIVIDILTISQTLIWIIFLLITVIEVHRPFSQLFLSQSATVGSCMCLILSPPSALWPGAIRLFDCVLSDIDRQPPPPPFLVKLLHQKRKPEVSLCCYSLLVTHQHFRFLRGVNISGAQTCRHQATTRESDSWNLELCWHLPVMFKWIYCT